MGETQKLSTGSPFEAQFAYSRPVVKGDWCFVAGITGYDYVTMTVPDAASDQAEQCFQTLANVLGEAGFEMADIVRMQYTVPSRDYVAALAPVLQRWLAGVCPAATMVIAGLIDQAMKVEIEATAFRG